jgi:predicted nucleic acid-binding protein
MNMKYSLDSNALIDYRRGHLPASGVQFLEGLFDTSSFAISVIVRLEVVGFLDTPESMRLVEDLVDRACVLPLDEAICVRTIALRRLPRKIKLWDAIIAATSLEYDLTLVTHNISDFKNVPDLRILNPHTLDLLPPPS